MSAENIVIASDAGIYIRTTDDIGELLGACSGASGVLLAHGERFSELVREHRHHSAVRFFLARADAKAWLAPG